MKYTAILILSFVSIKALSQSSQTFLEMYNRHIDPLGRLDSILIYSVTIKSQIAGKPKSIGGRNLGHINIDETSVCEYHASGEEKCINKENGTALDLGIIPLPENSKNSYIKYHVNIIPVSDFNSFAVKLANDSILVFEKVISLTQRHLFIFDAKTLNLLGTENHHRTQNEENFVSYMRYIEYQTVNGILIPKLIKYSSNICEASLEYKYVTFR
jgi:hypothetical protein